MCMNACQVSTKSDQLHRVATAKHVIGGPGAKNLQLQSASQGRVDADVLALSSRYDVAELSCAATIASAALDLGDHDLCNLGDIAYVCGYPYKLGDKPTLSLGHISKLNAEYKGETGLIQVSGAAINPGNSGGPVTNCDGMVIGILTMKVVKTDTQNIAFAEPIGRALLELNAVAEAATRSH
jgi:serine protease Do